MPIRCSNKYYSNIGIEVSFIRSEIDSPKLFTNVPVFGQYRRRDKRQVMISSISYSFNFLTKQEIDASTLKSCSTGSVSIEILVRDINEITKYEICNFNNNLFS